MVVGILLRDSVHCFGFHDGNLMKFCIGAGMER